MSRHKSWDLQWGWVKSGQEDGLCVWNNRKAHRKKGKLKEPYNYYYTHYFYYYAHYFQCLVRFGVAVSFSYALQIYVQRFFVLHQAEGWNGEAIKQIFVQVWCHFFSLLFHYYSNDFNFILIIAIWVGIRSRNQPNRHLHHRGFEFLATNMRIGSIGEHQKAFSHGRAGHHHISITNVPKPSGAHGRVKLIAWLGIGQ